MQVSLTEQQNAVQQRQAAIVQLELSVQEKNDMMSKFITKYSAAEMLDIRAQLEEYLGDEGYTYDSFTVYPLTSGKEATYLVILEEVDAFSIPRQSALTCALDSSATISDFKEYTLVP